jgi:hypothetical protein
MVGLQRMINLRVLRFPIETRVGVVDTGIKPYATTDGGGARVNKTAHVE